MNVNYLKQFRNFKLVVNCQTEKEVDIFCKLMRELDFRLGSGDTYTELLDGFLSYGKNVCYCKDPDYSHIQYAFISDFPNQVVVSLEQFLNSPEKMKIKLKRIDI